MADTQTTAIARRRYKAVSTGFWSYIVDRADNKTVSHDYDLRCDAEHYANEMNKEWRRAQAKAERDAREVA